MRRARLLAALGGLLCAATASAQLVPLARCHAAIPCSIPYGLRPADAVANLPDARLGNSLVGVGVGLDNGLKPRLAVSPVSEDPVEAASRLYVRKNPLKSAKPGATPTPGPKTAPATP